VISSCEAEDDLGVKPRRCWTFTLCEDIFIFCKSKVASSNLPIARAGETAGRVVRLLGLADFTERVGRSCRHLPGWSPQRSRASRSRRVGDLDSRGPEPTDRGRAIFSGLPRTTRPTPQDTRTRAPPSYGPSQCRRHTGGIHLWLMGGPSREVPGGHRRARRRRCQHRSGLRRSRRRRNRGGTTCQCDSSLPQRPRL